MSDMYQQDGKRRRQIELLRREEEQMTSYTPDDINGEWEFKIVRAANAAFRKPAKLQQLLAEEAQNVWTMVEKFDDGRVRFKRPRGTIMASPNGIDPYRTMFGGFQNGLGIVVAVVVPILMIILLVGGCALLAFLSSS